MICQGDIYWIDLGQPIGSEPAYITLAGLALVTEPEVID
jgi:mRNA-degrading endonuclease toxin of MazEF toxin-antitoxin module